jgi:hypothetical protein
MYGRLAVLPDAAESLQRSQLVAALAVGTEIIQLRHIASSLGLGSDVGLPLEALARGNSAIATAQLALLDDRLAARVPRPGRGRPLLSRRAGVSLRSRRRLTSMPFILMQESPNEVHLEFLLDFLVLARPAAAERPYVRVGRILPAPPAQPIVGSIKHIVGGDLRDKCHVKEMMPAVGARVRKWR